MRIEISVSLLFDALLCHTIDEKNIDLGLAGASR